MPKSELHPITHPDFHQSRGGQLINTYANGKIKEYDSSDPRLEINTVVNNHVIRIIVDGHPIFESHSPTDLDKVEIYKSHHKKVIFQLGDSVLDENGVFEHEVYTPDGMIGYAHGDKFDYYIASLFYSDPILLEKAAGHGSFDKEVIEYFEKQVGITGLFK